jgi:hypothetical protein
MTAQRKPKEYEVPHAVYVTEKDGQRVRIWSDDGKVDFVTDDDVRAWLSGKLTVEARTGLEFLHRKYIQTMIRRGDLRQDDRSASMLWVTPQAVERYKLPALPAAQKKLVVERVSALLAPVVQTSIGTEIAAKRALEQARKDAEILRKGVADPSPVDGLAVRLYVDDPKVGCGERGFLVRDVGPSIVRLFYVPLLAEVIVDRLTFDRHAKPYAVKVAKVEKRIDEAQACFERLDLDYNPPTTKAVLAKLAAA